MKSKQTVKQKRLIKLKEVKIEPKENGQCQVSVQLLCKRRTIVGERIGPDETDYKIMLAAQSTISALQKITEEQLKMDLLFIERQQLARIGREVIMVLIDLDVDGSTRAATGSCQVQSDPIEAAARAVLDATNRIIELYFE